MTYLDLAPAISALRSRPEDFEFSHDSLYHLRSRHRFHFVSEGDVRIDAACDCAQLRASREQAKALHGAYREWRASYWRSVEINREFASHFEPLPLWRRVAIGLLKRLSQPKPERHSPRKSVPSFQPVGGD